MSTTVFYANGPILETVKPHTVCPPQFLPCVFQHLPTFPESVSKVQPKQVLAQNAAVSSFAAPVSLRQSS